MPGSFVGAQAFDRASAYRPFEREISKGQGQQGPWPFALPRLPSAGELRYELRRVDRPKAGRQIVSRVRLVPGNGHVLTLLREGHRVGSPSHVDDSRRALGGKQVQRRVQQTESMTSRLVGYRHDP